MWWLATKLNERLVEDEQEHVRRPTSLVLSWIGLDSWASLSRRANLQPFGNQDPVVCIYKLGCSLVDEHIPENLLLRCLAISACNFVPIPESKSITQFFYKSAGAGEFPHVSEFSVKEPAQRKFGPLDQFLSNAIVPPMNSTESTSNRIESVSLDNEIDIEDMFGLPDHESLQNGQPVPFATFQPMSHVYHESPSIKTHRTDTEEDVDIPPLDDHEDEQLNAVVNSDAQIENDDDDVWVIETKCSKAPQLQPISESTFHCDICHNLILVSQKREHAGSHLADKHQSESRKLDRKKFVKKIENDEKKDKKRKAKPKNSKSSNGIESITKFTVKQDSITSSLANLPINTHKPKSTNNRQSIKNFLIKR